MAAPTSIPPIAATEPFSPTLSDAVRHIGQVDTVLVKTDDTHVGDNAAWKGIQATLNRDFVPSAYSKQAALILAGAESDASPAIFALKSLRIGPVYMIGFTTTGSMSSSLSPVRSIDDLKQLEVLFTILSAFHRKSRSLLGCC